MTRLVVKRFETVCCIAAIAAACFFVQSFLTEFVYGLTLPLEKAGYAYLGKWVITIPVFIQMVILSACQFALGGILLKPNKGLYGILCSLPAVALFAFTAMGKFQIYIWLSLAAGLVLFYFSAQLSGRVFEPLKSPIISFNWPNDSLTLDHDTPAYWVVYFNLLIVAYVWVTPLFMRKLIVQSTSTGFTALLGLGSLFYFLILILIRKENLFGCVIYIALYIPLFVLGEGTPRVSAWLFFLITVTLFALNRKQLTWI